MSRYLPFPSLTLGITLLWLVLASSYTLNSLILGAIVGVVLPLLVQPLMPDLPRIRRPGRAIGFFGLVLADIVSANFQVARLVLGPIERLEPRFFSVPLTTRSPFVATILGSIVSLTPGTVSIDIDMGQGLLHIHGLKVPDEAATIAEIKARYEGPLMEIFGC